MLFALLLTFANQPKNTVPPSPLPAIRRQYNTINRNLPRYSKVQRDIENYSNEGTTLQSHFSGSAPRKITLDSFGCHHRNLTEYYFWNNRLIFIYQVRINDTGLPDRKPLSRRESRFYFHQGRLVKWLAPKQPSASDLLQDARAWLAASRIKSRRAR